MASDSIPPLPIEARTKPAAKSEVQAGNAAANENWRKNGWEKNNWKKDGWKEPGKLLLCAAVLAMIVLNGGWICPFERITRIPCPACGMTRALQSLWQQDLHASLAWHPMLLPTLAAAAAGLILYFFNKKKALKHLLWIWAALMLTVWIVRLVSLITCGDFYRSLFL